MGSVSWQRGNRLIITGALGYAQRRVADGRKWLPPIRRKDVTTRIETHLSVIAVQTRSHALRGMRACPATAST
ncbi:hypothetical protein EMIT047CA2_130110 [Pseudomonas soli]